MHARPGSRAHARTRARARMRARTCGHFAARRAMRCNATPRRQARLSLFARIGQECCRCWKVWMKHFVWRNKHSVWSNRHVVWTNNQLSLRNTKFNAEKRTCSVQKQTLRADKPTLNVEKQTNISCGEANFQNAVETFRKTRVCGSVGIFGQLFSHCV